MLSNTFIIWQAYFEKWKKKKKNLRKAQRINSIKASETRQLEKSRKQKKKKIEIKNPINSLKRSFENQNSLS